MHLSEECASPTGLKAYVTNYTATALSVCRECCGGHGYAAVNRFGMWRSDHDIFQTFEGDNTVLLQQVCIMPDKPAGMSVLLHFPVDACETSLCG